jgi:hypothetical protein
MTPPTYLVQTSFRNCAVDATGDIEMTSRGNMATACPLQSL